MQTKCLVRNNGAICLMNDYLEELGKLVGLDTPIATTYFVGNNRCPKHRKYNQTYNNFNFKELV